MYYIYVTVVRANLHTWFNCCIIFAHTLLFYTYGMVVIHCFPPDWKFVRQGGQGATVTKHLLSAGVLLWSLRSAGGLTWTLLSVGVLTWSLLSAGVLTWSLLSAGVLTWSLQAGSPQTGQCSWVPGPVTPGPGLHQPGPVCTAGLDPQSPTSSPVISRTNFVIII